MQSGVVILEVATRNNSGFVSGIKFDLEKLAVGDGHFVSVFPAAVCQDYADSISQHRWVSGKAVSFVRISHRSFRGQLHARSGFQQIQCTMNKTHVDVVLSFKLQTGQIRCSDLPSMMAGARLATPPPW